MLVEALAQKQAVESLDDCPEVHPCGRLSLGRRLGRLGSGRGILQGRNRVTASYDSISRRSDSHYGSVLFAYPEDGVRREMCRSSSVSIRRSSPIASRIRRRSGIFTCTFVPTRVIGPSSPSSPRKVSKR